MSLISKVIANHPSIRHRIVAVVTLGNYEVGGTFSRWNHSKVQVHRASVDKIRTHLQPLPSASGLKIESFAHQEPGVHEEQVSLPVHNSPGAHTSQTRGMSKRPTPRVSSPSSINDIQVASALRHILYGKAFWPNDTFLASNKLCQFCCDLNQRLSLAWPLNQYYQDSRKGNEFHGLIISRSITDFAEETSCPFCNIFQSGLLPGLIPLDKPDKQRGSAIRYLLTKKSHRIRQVGTAKLLPTQARINILSDFRVTYQQEKEDAEGAEIKIDSYVSAYQGLMRLRLTLERGDGTEITKRCFHQFAADDVNLPEDEASQRSPTREVKYTLGRRMQDDVNYDLVRRWLMLCEKKHSDTCRPGFGQGLPQNFRVIDVEARLICRPFKNTGVAQDFRYAALSYVWGPPSVEQLKNVESDGIRALLYQNGGLDKLWSKLPYTIADAILFCSKLGVRYLWCDALCIEQDNLEDECIFEIMGDIYKGAYFTIVNAAASDSWSRLPGVVPGTRSVNQPVRQIGNVWYGAAQQSRKAKLEKSTWHHRGWTLQESILSTRLFIFTHDELVFECDELHAEWAEGMYLEHPAIMRDAHLGVLNFHKVKSKVYTKDMSRWGQLVNQYSQRQLTNVNDTIRAFEGISRSIADGADSSVFYGHVLAFFYSSLAFTVGVTVRQRRTQFPSWSWAGWNTQGLSQTENFEFHDLRFVSKLIPRMQAYRLEKIEKASKSKAGTHTGHYIRIDVFSQAESATGNPRYVPKRTARWTPHPKRLMVEGQIATCLEPHILLFENADVAHLPVSRHGAELPTQPDIKSHKALTRKYDVLPDSWRFLYDNQKPLLELDEAWRDSQPDELEFVAVGVVNEYNKDYPRDVYTLIIETDGRGISQRVAAMSITYSTWERAERRRRRVFLG
jgi:hypothetical protein